ncbi:isoamyl acetate-hydrolyzing esterase [Coemansia erecta]|uniref:Isoamyl acetate-hydrolyzing esterase n=1 Tax=Coemansia erecta TaxID=147472 RepID=A0A9W8CVG1_9FUNG|nr:isoamyl acetate-hydrolyzing esterase [Coemansia erecta]
MNNKAEHPQPYRGAMYDIVLTFGDSITQFGGNPAHNGWVNSLSHLFERRMDVLNRGFSGYNTNDARGVVHLVLPRTKSLPGANPASSAATATTATTNLSRPFPNFSPKVQLLLIFFGANDAVLKPGYQHVPLDVFAANMRYLVSLVKDPESEYYSPETRVALITPPPLGESLYNRTSAGSDVNPIKRTNAMAKVYSEAVKDAANDLGVPYIDLWSSIEDRVHRAALAEQASPSAAASPYDGYERYLLDGLHLNANGNQLLFKLIESLIDSNWPELRS